MTTTTAADLQAFHEFVVELLRDQSGAQRPTPDECLELWHLKNRTPEEYAADVQAIREGLEDMYAGRTRPAREFHEEMRRKYGLRGGR